MLSSITATLKTSKFLPTDVECSQRRRTRGSTGAAQSNFVSFLEYHVRGPVIPNVMRLRAAKDMSLEVHKIKEIHPGVFWMLLDFPTSRLLPFILSDEYRYIWCHNHRVGNYSWAEYRLPLFRDNDAHDVASRIVLFDFIVSTEKFKEILPKVDAGVHVIQLNEMPPDHFDLDKIKGKERYRLLRESDWLFEFDVPGNDYGHIASPKEELLHSLLRNPAIDLKDLP